MHLSKKKYVFSSTIPEGTLQWLYSNAFHLVLLASNEEKGTGIYLMLIRPLHFMNGFRRLPHFILIKAKQVSCHYQAFHEIFFYMQFGSRTRGSRRS